MSGGVIYLCPDRACSAPFASQQRAAEHYVIVHGVIATNVGEDNDTIVLLPSALDRPPPGTVQLPLDDLLERLR